MKATLINDAHSQLNPTRLKKIVSVESLEQVREIIKTASAEGAALCIAGGRHAMGAQQFATDGILLDMSKMDRVISLDTDNGLLEVEAGIQWPALITEYLSLQKNKTKQWGIAQKQTGADQLSIGGTLSSNSHGRGLMMRPFIENIESFKLLDCNGEVRICNRNANYDLFRLAIGGYGLFGVVVSITLRLIPRLKVQRLVEIITIDSLIESFDRQIADGCSYGDFQFAIDAASDDFLSAGVLSTYKPVTQETRLPEEHKELSQDEWNNLAYLVHTDKSKAFQHYVRHYLSTANQIYWSDTHQLSSYIDNYHELLNARLAKTDGGTEIISELYVPRDTLIPFMDKVRNYFREHKSNLIYGTIRLIQKEDESFLVWARKSWACIVFNLHTNHTPEGIERSAQTFRYLIDLAISFGGSYSLTYHKFATKEQIERCYPKLKEFLALKIKYDPQEIFQSDWYRHYKRMFRT